MMKYEEIREIVKSKLSEYRFHHSECVAKRCMELAEKYGVDIEKAKLIGIVHDIAKEIPNNEKIQYCLENNIKIDDIEMINPGILHAPIAADIAKKKFEFDDEMCSAISCHTTGKSNMSTLDKILYIADVSGEDRNFQDKDYVIKLSDENLDKCVLYILEYCITERLKDRQAIHMDSIYAFNDLLN